ncbi:MAG: ABC transporter permease [Bacteroidales bacterium]
MFIIYIKQTWQLIKENRVLSGISIFGTALAMAIIIALVFVYQIQVSNCKPEINRDRTLYINSLELTWTNRKGVSTSSLSHSIIKECLYPLKNAEAVTAVTNWTEPMTATTVDGRNMINVPYIATDAAIWKVFSFQFIEGSPFTAEEVESGVRRAVISERVALHCFNSIDEAVGSIIKLDHREYIVCGVVPNLSSFVVHSYADVWIPYTSMDIPEPTDDQGKVLGDFSCLILAKSTNDFDAIKKEVNQAINQFAIGLKDRKISLLGQPNTHLEQLTKLYSNQEADLKGTIIRYGAILLILLLVPAINLSGFTITRMRRRTAEIGIRKTFGATRKDIVSQMIYENLIVTLIGGVIGITAGYFVFNLVAHWYLGNTLAVQTGRLSAPNPMTTENISFIFQSVFNPLTLLYIFLFCLLLNMLSATIPSWIISRKTIINALNEQK